jgi:hypothetical protein
MSEKATSAAKSTVKPATTKSKVSVEVPKGFTDQSLDVVGFYDPDVQADIQFVPNEAVLSDSTIEPRKVSILVFGTLVEDCKLVETSKSGNVIEGKKGDSVGIWAKPGMRALRNLAGVHVVMYPDGEKDTGKPNPMTLFKVLAAKKGSKLSITEDRRDKSKAAETWLDVKTSGEANQF